MYLKSYTYECCVNSVLLLLRQSRIFISITIYKNNTEGYSFPVRTQNISNIKTIFIFQELDLEHHKVLAEFF